MNYFSDFLGLTFLGSLWIYLALVLIDGTIGLKDFLKNIRLGKNGKFK